jgi:hypothetical protein
MMLLSDSVGGAEERRNGFGNRSPVNVTANGDAMAVSLSAGLLASLYQEVSEDRRIG